MGYRGGRGGRGGRGSRGGRRGWGRRRFSGVVRASGLRGRGAQGHRGTGAQGHGGTGAVAASYLLATSLTALTTALGCSSWMKNPD